MIVLTPSAFMGTDNFEEAKGGPLSNTSVTSKTCLAIMVHNLSMVCEAGVELTTDYSENASMVWG